MQLVRSKSPAFFATLAALFLAVTSLFAQTDYTLTGTSIRVKKVVFVDVNVYEISHYMKQLPASKSKQAVIDMDAGKKFVWKMLRDVDQEKIVAALKEAYAMNGYNDATKIGKFVSGFKGELKTNATVTIAYDADKKTTTLTTGGSSVSVEGVDFMKATWSIWLGKIDQPKLGDQLISKLP
jgi:hypothetical protein